MATLAAAGIGETIEFGAGRVLAGLMRRINRNLKVRSAEDAASLRATIQALALRGRPITAYFDCGKPRRNAG